MGWFDEQIRESVKMDDDAFQSAMAGMAGVVMGERIARAFADDRIKTKNAIDEVLKFYHVVPSELPDRVKDFNDQLECLMRPAGIMRRTVVLDDGWYKDAVGAMMGVRKNGGGAVALLPGKFSGYTYLDRETGRRIRITKENAGEFENEAVCFYKPLPAGKLGVNDLVAYMAGTLSQSDLVVGAIAVLAVTLVGMLVPALTNIVYGQVIEMGSMQLFFAVFAFLICASLSQLMLGAVRDLLLSRISTKLSYQVEAAGMMRLLSLPAAFFKRYGSGDLAMRMGYLPLLCENLTNALLTTGLTSLFSLVYIAQMFRYAPGVVAPGMLVIFVTAAFGVATAVVQTRVSRKAMDFQAKESAIDYALISGVQKIKLAGAEKRAFARWAEAYTPAAKLTYDVPMFLKLSPVVTTSVALVGTTAIYWFAVTTDVSLADYFAFNSAYGMVLGAFMALVSIATTFAQVKPMIDMLKPVLSAEPEVSKNKKVVTRLSGGIELSNVSFRYAYSMPLVIDDLSLKIRPGQYVAVVGGTGCGKSTLMRLMLGFETPQKGAVYFDGKDLAALDLKSLRRNIGTVMQDGKLFQGDIFSNIAISAPGLTMDEAWEAAELAGIADDIRAMPMGMSTMISEGSGGVSGGQRQRLMIARAIAGKPRILMFDEATSALDNVTQKQVSDSLDNLKCTRIVIAHRLSTIKQCDRVLMLDRGRIVEDGTYDELLEKGGFFAELVARQRLDVPGDAGNDS